MSDDMASAMNLDDLALATGELTGPTRARAVAMQALYELDSTGHDLETVVRRRLEADETPDGSATYASRLIQGVVADRPEIDALLEAAAPAWPLDQMSRVDKSILRLAIFEMLREKGLSAKIIINEAVELAKRFGHDSSPKFVNGVLGTIERNQREQKQTR
jgi:transcription antitermination protein NusB